MNEWKNIIAKYNVITHKIFYLTLTLTLLIWDQILEKIRKNNYPASSDIPPFQLENRAIQIEIDISHQLVHQSATQSSIHPHPHTHRP